MSELNVEYVESIVKLALIEQKKHKLEELGYQAAEKDIEGHNERHWALGRLREYEEIDALIRDAKKLRHIAEQIVRASREASQK